MSDPEEFDIDLSSATRETSNASHGEKKSNVLKAELGMYGKGMAIDGPRKRNGKKRAEPEVEPDEEETLEEEADEEEATRQAEEVRRKSRARKAEELKRMMEDEEPAATKRRSKRKSSREDNKVDDTPLSVTLWVYLLFGIVVLDRTIKLISRKVPAVYLSKAIGSILIIAAFGVKVPQIQTVLSNKSVDGLSPAKFYTGALSLMLTCVYHIFNKSPVTAWGDSLAVLLQDMTLIGLIWQYSKTPAQLRTGLVCAFVGLTTITVTFAMNTTRRDPLLILATIIGQSGTVPQIMENHKNRHTGTLSFITQLMMFLGSVARVFTTLQEMPDPVVLISFLVGAIFNGFLLAQVLMYWANTNKVLRAQKRRSK